LLVQVDDLKSNASTDLIPIGEASVRLQMRPSALRFVRAMAGSAKDAMRVIHCFV
jgi:hypothetical protein